MRALAIANPLTLMLLAACHLSISDSPRTQENLMAQAERIIDAFYSFDRTRLAGELADAPASHPHILYYQGWAEGGHYVVLHRKPCAHNGKTTIACSITVRDDLIAALGTGYDVTDTFHFQLAGERIVGVTNTSNDPPEFDQALDWVKAERSQVMSGPCQGFFKGGPTPGDCARAVVAGFGEFALRRSTIPNPPAAPATPPAT